MISHTPRIQILGWIGIALLLVFGLSCHKVFSYPELPPQDAGPSADLPDLHQRDLLAEGGAPDAELPLPGVEVLTAPGAIVSRAAYDLAGTSGGDAVAAWVEFISVTENQIYTVSFDTLGIVSDPLPVATLEGLVSWIKVQVVPNSLEVRIYFFMDGELQTLPGERDQIDPLNLSEEIGKELLAADVVTDGDRLAVIHTHREASTYYLTLSLLDINPSEQSEVESHLITTPSEGGCMVDPQTSPKIITLEAPNTYGLIWSQRCAQSQEMVFYTQYSADEDFSPVQQLANQGNSGPFYHRAPQIYALPQQFMAPNGLILPQGGAMVSWRHTSQIYFQILEPDGTRRWEDSLDTHSNWRDPRLDLAANESHLAVAWTTDSDPQIEGLDWPFALNQVLLTRFSTISEGPSSLLFDPDPVTRSGSLEFGEPKVAPWGGGFAVLTVVPYLGEYPLVLKRFPAASHQDPGQ